ncbi:galactose-1-epimerase [Psychromonas sp.]|uniref:galactose-1-epimerase n=1 Tax=Psychromonas sp. TaxID=1884585 RepID=UPI0039E2C38D
MSLLQKMTQTDFSDGQKAKIFTLTNKHGSTISVMDIGATWLSCKIQLATELREVLLGVDSMEKQLAQSAYMGATVGRYANRIHRGQFGINGLNYQLDTNQNGNTLHGGSEGFDKRRWQVAQQENNKITFALFSADGDQGFPGNLTVSVSYQFDDDNEVAIEYLASCDKACPVNLTNHAYFNLSGAESGENCFAHSLQINAQQYLPTDAQGIPLGALATVKGTGFDFLTGKKVGRDFMLDADQKLAGGYDHCFLIDPQCSDGKQAVAQLVSPDNALSMLVSTSAPAVQLYTGNFLDGNPSRKNTPYNNHAGLALETQLLPDSPNHPEWPQASCVLQPGQTYQSHSCYKFQICK